MKASPPHKHGASTSRHPLLDHVAANGISKEDLHRVLSGGEGRSVYDEFVRRRLKHLQVLAKEKGTLEPTLGWAWNFRNEFRYDFGKNRGPLTPSTAIRIIFLRRRGEIDPSPDPVSGVVAASLLRCEEPKPWLFDHEIEDFHRLRQMFVDLRVSAKRAQMQMYRSLTQISSNYVYRKFRRIIDQWCEEGMPELWTPSGKKPVSARQWVITMVKTAKQNGIIKRRLPKDTRCELESALERFRDGKFERPQDTPPLEMSLSQCYEKADMVLAMLPVISVHELRDWVTREREEAGRRCCPLSPSPALSQVDSSSNHAQVERGANPDQFGDLQIGCLSRTLQMLVQQVFYAGQESGRMKQLLKREHVQRTDSALKMRQRGSQRSGTDKLAKGVAKFRQERGCEPTPKNMIEYMDLLVRKAGSGSQGCSITHPSMSKVPDDRLEVHVAQSESERNEGWISFEAFERRVQKLTRRPRGRPKK
jgi:hypothetical protein